MNTSISPRLFVSGIPVALAALVGFALAGGCARRTPPDRDVLSALNAAAQVPSRTFREIKTEAFPRDVDKVLVKFTATAQTSEPFYEAVRTEDYFASTLGLDLGALKQALAAAKNPHEGTRLLELAHTGLPATDWATLTLIKPASPVGTRESYRGQVTATKDIDRWIFSGWDVHREGPAASGLPRAKFPGTVYDVSTASDRAIAAKIAAGLANFTQRVAAAQKELARIHAEARANALSAARGVLKPGTLFAGSMEGPEGAVPLYLEIVAPASEPDTSVAMLRNDGGWRDARHAWAKAAVNQEDDSPVLVFGSNAKEAVADAGPVLSAKENLQWDLRVAEGALSASWDGQSVRFRKVEDPNAVRRPFEEAEQQLRDSTRSGRSWQGVSTPKQNGTPAAVILRITRNEAVGAIIEATLESIDNNQSLRLTGSIATNKYAHGGWPVTLVGTDNDAFRLQLKWRDGKLAGQSSNGFDFTLEPATPEFLAQVARQHAQSEARYFGAVAPGRLYIGIARNPTGRSVELALRFTRLAAQGQELAGRIESARRPEQFATFRGSIDPYSGAMRLSLESPAWEYFQWRTNFRLQVTEGGISGSADGDTRFNDGDLSFEFRPAETGGTSAPGAGAAMP